MRRINRKNNKIDFLLQYLNSMFCKLVAGREYEKKRVTSAAMQKMYFCYIEIK
jgi:hypothetical protein